MCSTQSGPVFGTLHVERTRPLTYDYPALYAADKRRAIKAELRRRADSKGLLHRRLGGFGNRQPIADAELGQENRGWVGSSSIFCRSLRTKMRR